MDSSADFIRYITGIFHEEPKAEPTEEVENAVNARSPTGISSPWKISKDTHFKTGEENGYHCTYNGKRTRHWLLSC